MYGRRDFELIIVAAQFQDEAAAGLAFLKKQKASNKNQIFGDTDKYKLIEAFRAGLGRRPAVHHPD